MNSAKTDTIIAGYEAAAPRLIDQYDGLSSDRLYEPVLDLIPCGRFHALDVGAGSGRDAAWLADRGGAVTAVEPTEALRTAGAARTDGRRASWIDDRLPRLETVCALGRSFGLILLSGVWQHIDDEDRAAALPVLSALTKAGGLVVISVRNGPGADDRPCFPADADALIALAEQNNLRCVRNRSRPSMQAGNRAAGVTWNWVALKKEP
ncbi:MAG: class I SAM-dependent methyltransferase [Pseudomonadota bacterium]